MNPLMQGIAPTMGGINPSVIQQIKQMAGMLQNIQNPQAALMQMVQQNPQLGAVIQMCKGRNPQDVFSDECRKHGLDPKQAMQQIQSMIGI